MQRISNANMIAPFKTLKKHNDQRIEFTAWKILVVVLIAPSQHVSHSLIFYIDFNANKLAG